LLLSKAFLILRRIQSDITISVKVKVKQSRNRPGVAQRLAGVLGSQISMIFGT
jgi:hypothetical protein